MSATLQWGRLLLPWMVFLMTVEGCLGPKLLQERSERSPAKDPKVELRLKTEGTTDVLVAYDEENQQTGAVTRRGFYLLANEERLVEGKVPVFITPGYIGRHVNIPIFKEAPAAPADIPGDLYALSPSPWKFELRSRDRVLIEFRLPEYGKWLTAKKFFLFPLAAAADAVGVGAAAGAVGAVVALEGAARSGVSFTFP